MKLLEETAEEVEIYENRKRKKKNMDPGFSGRLMLMSFKSVRFSILQLEPVSVKSELSHSFFETVSKTKKVLFDFYWCS